MTDVSLVAVEVRCTECGRRVRRRGPDRFIHASRTEAACDLDSDHEPLPDWQAVGEVPCRACGAPTVGTPGGFVHVDAAHDADHKADPALLLL